MSLSEWSGLYAERWRGDLVPEAYAHPAKMARGLTRRIYDHLRDEGWTVPGATVLDPFGGIAGTALEAMLHGLRYRAVELEPRFVALGGENLALWRSRYSALPGFCGDATLVQGDSRRLGEALGGAGACVSSPPYSESHIAAIKSGSRSEAFLRGDDSGSSHWVDGDQYGSTSGNLGNLRATDAGFAVAVASPPFEESNAIQGNQQRGGGKRLHESGDRFVLGTPGQLGAMRVAVSSPPYERDQFGGGGAKHDKVIDAMKAGYGSTPGNLESADDFWSAARLIVQQTHAALAPGGHAVWVVKSFVRNKALVDFPGQWRALCESVGFATLHEHHALLTEHRGAQHALDGSTDELTTERKSFFRRLAERKGSPRIDWETIYCMERP